jgi:hypothetical protein
VQLPADQPLASVSVLPVPGWTYTVTKAKLATRISSDDGDITEAVSVVEWKAAGRATTALVLAIVAMILGAAALAVAGIGRRAGRTS